MTKIYNGSGEYTCHLESGRTLELTEEEIAELIGSDFIHSSSITDIEDFVNSLDLELLEVNDSFQSVSYDHESLACESADARENMQRLKKSLLDISNAVYELTREMKNLQ